MSNSSLVSYTRLSPNHSGRRKYAITKITPHYMAGNCSVETCGAIFAPTSRQASSNYGIGSDGRVALYVDEANRSWCSSSSDNDNRAVTIECANLADSSLTDACWKSLVALCVDICRRNGIPKLTYTGGKDGTLTEHRMFANTDCPGTWLHSRMGLLAQEVNKYLTNGTTPKAGTGASATSTASVGTSAKSTALASGYHKDASFAGRYRCTVDYLRVRRSPSLSGTEVAHYSKGETVALEGYYWVSGGFVWGTYIGGSGNRNYIAVGKATGKAEPDDYLVRV